MTRRPHHDPTRTPAPALDPPDAEDAFTEDDLRQRVLDLIMALPADTRFYLYLFLESVVKHQQHKDAPEDSSVDDPSPEHEVQP
jgi:hypothetical protein